jgi:double-stranded uracil-DNA glycosylase
MGEQVETLEDLLRPDLRAACVGINPSLVSLERGHYYQGRLGLHFYKRLQRARLLPASFDGYQDDALFERGVGFTDIVKRPTPRAHHLDAAEFAHGRQLLLEKLERFRPGLVIFSYKKTAEILLGRFSGTGERPSVIDGVRMFVMPGPYAKAEAVDVGLAELAELLDDQPSARATTAPSRR